MQSFPLRLDTYYFTEVKILADPAFSANEDNVSPCIPEKISTEAGAVHDEAMLNFNIRLKIDIENDNHSYPYDISIGVVGYFTLPDVIPAEDRFRVGIDNGLSLLYSSMREFVLSISSRCPHGPTILPTVSFVGHHEKMEQHTSEEPQE